MAEHLPPTYIDSLIELAEPIRPGEVRLATVWHDDGCPMLDGTGACSCNPDVRWDDADTPWERG